MEVLSHLFSALVEFGFGVILLSPFAAWMIWDLHKTLQKAIENKQ